MNQYAQLALQRYPGAKLVNDGAPWMAVFKCGATPELYFAPDEETVRRVVLGGCSARECHGNQRYENVREFALPKCCDAPDDFEDKQWLRRNGERELRFTLC